MAYYVGYKMPHEEDLNIEYKEMSFELDIFEFLERRDMKKIVLEGEFPPILNWMMEKNLELYMDKYFGKYITSFANTEDITSGSLYFGINDDSFVTGIPFSKEPDIKLIESLFEKYLNTIRIRSYNNNREDNEKAELLTEELKRSVSYEFMEMPVRVDYDKAHDIIKKFKKHNDFVDNGRRRIKRMRDEWYARYCRYDISILKISNNRRYRTEIANKIIEEHSDEDALRIADFFRSDAKITIVNEEVKRRKNNRNDPMYWITRFRDKKKDEIYREKPSSDFPHKKFKYYRYICKLLNPMIYRWSRNGVKYYLLKIKLNDFNYDKDNFYAEYAKNFGTPYENWYSRYRTMCEVNGASTVYLI